MEKKDSLWFYNLLTVTTAILVVVFMVQFITQNALKLWPDYTSMQSLSSPIAWIRWILGDMSEAQFYKSELASLGLLIGAITAHMASVRKKNWKGFDLSYGTGLFPWILFSSTLGLILSNILWGWTVIKTDQWQPTFVTFVSLPAAVVLMYGRGLKVACVGAFLGAILVAPSSLLLVNYVCMPLNLPNIIGNVSGMALGSLIALFLLHKYPTLIAQSIEQNNTSSKEEDLQSKTTNLTTQKYGPTWTIRRMLADFSESQFFANELAGLGYLIGVFLAIYLNPLSIAYGSGLIGKILIAQVLSAGIAILVWRKKWELYGWYPTYIPISSVAPAAVLVYQGSLTSIIVGAVLGAILAPPLARKLSLLLANYQHPYIGNVISMAVTTLLTVGVIGLIPTLS